MISSERPTMSGDNSSAERLFSLRPDRTAKGRLWMYGLLLLCVALYLFLTSGRGLNVYDQGIALTAMMRAAAGQVPHRDFYFNYGPAGTYMALAGAKIFGPSLLALTIQEVVENAATALFFYICARRLSNRRIAVAALIGCLLWSQTLGLMTLFPLWSTWLLMQVFETDAPNRRIYACGFMAGFVTLSRYDLGFGLAATHVVVICIAGMMRQGSIRESIRRSIPIAALYLAGWATLVVPLFVVYYAVGALPDFWYDIVRYPAKYYHMSRNLPFPRVHPRRNFEDIVVYAFPVLIAVAFYEVAHWWVRTRRSRDNESVPQWVAALVSFGAVAVVMYVKGLVRISAGSLFMCTASCILLGVVLYAHRASMSRLMSGVTVLLLVVFAIGGISSAYHGFDSEYEGGSLMAGWLFHRSSQAPYGRFRAWCGEHNPLTEGVCYFPDNDHIDAVRYIVAHTKPSDTLYVGLPSHDRVFANDNLTYFAAQRMPATKWSHFDPFLQTRADIQQQMIQELEKNRPPYVVLDSEFDRAAEPNGSSVHTGVHLLDDFIASHYEPVKQFGELTILRQR